ncbi:MAG: hypothetical protein AB1801_19715, partial [Chloroflexota bacterium]
MLPVFVATTLGVLAVTALSLARHTPPVRAWWASVPANSAVHHYCPSPTTEPPTPTPLPESEWRDVCANHRLEITGAGLGDAVTSLNPQTLSLSNPEQITWLLAQAAGRYTGSQETPAGIVFNTTQETITLDSPTRNTGQGYTFETNVQPAGQITTWINNTGSDFKTPRGLIVYARRNTALEPWTSVGRTLNEFVYRQNEGGSHSEVLTFEALSGPTELQLTAAVIDNNEDERPLALAAQAGPITASQSFTGPTEGPLLNIVSLTLPQVPSGTDRVTVTLRSPPENGDSLVWVGVNVGYRCGNGGNDSRHQGIYLPIILKDYEPLICNSYDFNTAPSGWLVDLEGEVKTGYTDNNAEYFIQRSVSGIRIVQGPVDYSTHYTVTVDVHWNDIGYEYGLIFGQIGDADSLTYRFGIDLENQRYRVRLGSVNDDKWECV